MNILCPNCQKMLAVSEEFAGKLMKCPLCHGDFTVPSLPGSASLQTPTGAPEPDIYPIRYEPSPPPPVSPPTLHLSSLAQVPPAPSPPPPPPPSPVSRDYQGSLSMSLNPKVLPWIAPVCLLLVFFLQFFDWAGLYPGGEPAAVGNAWRIAFGVYAVDGDLKSFVPFAEDERYKPGVSILTIFYLLLFFPVLAVTVASVVIPMISVKWPPQVENLMPWRWGIVAAANLIVFLFLGLQLLLGFSLENRYHDWVNETKREAKGTPTTQERKLADVTRGELLERLRYTFWLRLVVLLHLSASISSALMVWMDRRGPYRPLPKWEWKW